MSRVFGGSGKVPATRLERLGGLAQELESMQGGPSSTLTERRMQQHVFTRTLTLLLDTNSLFVTFYHQTSPKFPSTVVCHDRVY